MASNNRRLIWNTRERLLSTDLNDATALLNAKGTDEVAAALTGDLFNSAVPLSGLFSGGIVSANGANTTVSVSPMLGLKHGSPATGLDSNYLKVETLAAIDVDLTAFVDPGNPRWVAIEASPGDAQEVVSSRDIFQPALGTFIPVNVDKIRKPQAVLSVNAGVASPNPVLPNGNPDVIPLAYVYLTASAASIPATDVVRCRAVINTNTLDAQYTRNRGGLNVNAPGGTTVALRSYSVKFGLKPSLTTVIDGSTLDATLSTSAQWVSGQSYPAGGNTPIYAYVASPPFPTGYDSDVSDNREWLDTSGRIPSSNIANVANGIIIWSTVDPANNSTLAPHPAGSVAINDPTWGTGTTSSTSYIGSVSVQTNGGAGISTQQTRGDRVRMTEDAKLCSDYDTQSTSDSGLQPGVFSNRSPLLIDNDGQGLGVVLRTASEWDVVVWDENTGAGENYTLTVIASGEPSSVGPIPGMPTFGALNSPGDVYTRQSQNELRTTYGTGGFTWQNNCIGVGTSRLRVVTLGYQDPVLANR